MYLLFIFDEIDAGIGGAVAQVVGQQMRGLGERRQVLCVTHLAQVASQAHQHVQVEKRAGTAFVETQFEQLTGEARVEEVARMISGVDITTPDTSPRSRNADPGGDLKRLIPGRKGIPL